MARESIAWPPEYYQRVINSSPRFRFIHYNPGYRAVRRVLPRYLRPEMRVLDLGCGIGIGAAHLVAAGARGVSYSGVDPDPEPLRTAREVLTDLPADRVRGTIIQDTAQAFLATAPPESVDLVLWSFSLHECVDLARPAPLAELGKRVARVLAPQGILIVNDPFFAPGAQADEVERAYQYVADMTEHSDRGKFIPREVMIEGFTGAGGLELRESYDLPHTYLARYKGLPHARCALLVFAKAAGRMTS
jgi:SAM-dependent methyltransferase